MYLGRLVLVGRLVSGGQNLCEIEHTLTETLAECIDYLELLELVVFS